MIYYLVGILILTILLWSIIKLPKKFKESMVLDIAFLIIIFFLVASILNIYDFFNNDVIMTYISTVKNMMQILLLFLIILVVGYAVIGFLGKRYSLRIDNFNIGGINIFFDKSNEIFIKTVGTFIASKRTLFNFNKKRDNISEVLNAYYETYKYIKDNIELLNNKKDKELYSLSVEMLKKLNNFLATHQNDYRRWYDKITESDEIKISSSESIIVHKTTIEIVQKNYYRYDELLEGIKSINEYFSQENIQNAFKIEEFDWSEELDA